MSQPFQLNFNNDKKVVSVTLLDDDGIFQLANLFKDLLDKAGIANTITETPIENAEQISENIGD
jgi:metal-dependent HD superfamily phosphatase/phosphodiesterase